MATFLVDIPNELINNLKDIQNGSVDAEKLLNAFKCGEDVSKCDIRVIYEDID